MEKIEEPRTEINLNDVEIKDLNENVFKIDDICKQLGNIIFTNAESIEVSDHARKLHGGEMANVTENELSEIMQILSSKPYYRPFAQLQILNYLNNKLKTLKN